MAKKFFWLKLKEDFFRNKKIKKLRKIAGGDTYTVIYLKMQLLSLQNEGTLIYEGVESSFAEEIALEIDEDIDNVKITISFLTQNGLLEEITQDHFVMTETIECIGSEGSSAERVRRHRALKQQKVLQCNTPVTTSNTEIDIEKEKELEIDKEEDIDSPAKAEQHIPYKEIIEYLNLRTGSNYRHTTQKTRDLIKARFKEGFTLLDFQEVIDKKTVEWVNTDMQKYLRPETLFGTKFEGYLNQQVKERKLTTRDIQDKIDLSDF